MTAMVACSDNVTVLAGPINVLGALQSSVLLFPVMNALFDVAILHAYCG